MVCSRCKLAVRSILENEGLVTLSVELGEVELQEPPTKNQIEKLDSALKKLGFQIIDNYRSEIIEKIKNAIVTLVHHSSGEVKTNLSAFITSKVHHDYSYLSKLFSEVEGTTIEKYFISQRIERAKELLVYNEMTLSQIANHLGYSSVAYLSNQFKTITGFTPTHFKSLKEIKRRNIEEI